MKTYYHAKTAAFYMDEVHGPRTIMVDDPFWTRPLLEVLAPSIDELETEPVFISIPDEKAYPPQVEIANPGCSLPPLNELVEISQARHIELLHAQERGRVIVPDAHGAPIDSPPPALSDEQQVQRERAWRDQMLAVTDPLVVRHRDEMEVGRPTTLSAEQYQRLQVYRLDLRHWPEHPEFPALAARPLVPEDLKALLQ